MLYQKKLDKIIYNRYKHIDHIDHDELDLVIISGYVGPGPIKKISEIPLHTTIVYGMYACNGISQALHNTLINDDNKFNNVDIYYSSFPVHSKLYMWRYQGVVIDALVGSANFSTNGLTNPFRETLAEPTYDTFSDLDNYIELVLSQAIRCRNGIASPTHKLDVTAEIYNPHICRIPLYATKMVKTLYHLQVVLIGEWLALMVHMLIPMMHISEFHQGFFLITLIYFQ